MGLIKKLREKYDVVARFNEPQFVYGPPKAVLKEMEKEQKMVDKNCIFEAFEGGFRGPSSYYFVNEYDGTYYFRFGYSKNGKVIKNHSSSIDLYSKYHDKEYYETMLSEIKEIVKDWEKEYNDNSKLDGTSWHLDVKNDNIKYSGLNQFPENYNKLITLLNKYFNVDDYDNYMDDVNKNN